MANVSNYGLIGVGQNLKFSKGGANLQTNTTTFTLKRSDNSTDAVLGVGDVNSSGNVSLTTAGGTFSIDADTTLSRQQAGVFQLNGTAAVMVPNGTMAQRPSSAAAAMLRYNSDSTTMEYYNGTVWTTLATGGTAVTAVSVVTANGFAGSSSGGTTPALTLTTTASGLLAGSAGTLVTAVSGTDIKTVGGLSLVGSGDAGTITVPYGGTGATSLTGYVYGNGASPMTASTTIPTSVLTGILSPANGGTGVNNGVKTITLGGNISTGGAFTTTPANDVTLTTTGATNVTLPTSGTLLTTADTSNYVASIIGTTNQINPTTTSTGAVTLSLSSTLVAPGTVTVTSDLTVHGLTYESATSGITAHAGGGQGSATALTTNYNVVNTVATAGDSVKLPASAVGLEVTVVNIGTNTLAVFPSTGDQIDGGAVNASVPIPSGGTATYQSDNAGNWYTIDPVVVTSGPGLSVLYSPGETVLTNTGVTSFSTGSTGLTSGSTGAVTLAGILNPASGGTGVNNGSSTITLNGGNFALSGPDNVTLTTTGATNVTLPTSGTLATVSGTVASFQTSLSGLSPSTATTGAITLSGTLGVASGGTGDTTLATNGVLFGNGTSPVGVTVAGSQYQVLNAGAGGVPAFDAVHLDQAAAVTGLLPLTNGGTNASLTAVAGAPVYSTGSAFAIGTAGTTGQAYISGGAGAPTWQTVASTLTTNQILEGDGAGAFTANGGTFVGSGSFSGVTLSGTVTNATDATTKAYVDSLVAGLSWKQAVVASTTANVLISNPGTAVFDGVTLTTGQRLLVRAQTAQTENGIYIFNGAASALTRSPDAATGPELAGAAVFVELGTTYANSAWVQTTDPVTLGTSNIVWSQFSGGSVYTFTSGLNTAGSTISVRTDGVTTYIDGSNNVAVDSSAVTGQVLTSSGTAGTTATWGAVDLTNSNAVSGSLTVTHGGTGLATATVDGVVYGNGTSALGVTAAGTTGDVLVGNTGGAPSFAALSSIAVTSFQTSLSGLTPSTATNGVVTLAGTLGVASGGTGATTLTQHGVLLGEGTGAISATAVGTTGQVLAGVTGADPAFTTLSTLAVTSLAGTANQIDVSSSTGAVTVSLDPVLIAPGSLEVTTTTKFDGLTYESTANVTATAGNPALTAEFNIVTTTGSGQGVTLPVPAYAGVEISVVNTGANSVSVYPNAGGTIDGAGTGNPIVVPAGGTWTGQAATTTQWYSVDPVTVNGTGISVTYSNGQTSISNTGVLSFSGGTTGLTPFPAVAGNVTLAGTLVVGNGGTGVATLTANGMVYGNGTSAVGVTAAGSQYQVFQAGASGVPTVGAVHLDQAAAVTGTLPTTNGGTGLSSFAANEIFYAGTTSTMDQDAGLTYTAGTTATLGLGGSPNGMTLAANTTTGDVTMTALGVAGAGDIVLLPATTGSVIVGPAGNGLIQSDAGFGLTVQGNTTLALDSVTGNTSMGVTGSNYITVAGVTASTYVTSITGQPNALVNVQYVTDAIATAAEKGAVKAYTMTVPLNANGSTNIGAALPANSIVLQVKVKVTTADAAATLSVGTGATPNLYMTTAENDPQTIGLYVAEVDVLDASGTQITATVASTAGTAGSSCTVTVTYQLAD